MIGAALHLPPTAAPDSLVEDAWPGAMGHVVRLRRCGVLGAVTAAGVRDLVRNHASIGCGRLVVDFETVGSIDAAGITALLEARRLVETGAGGALSLHVAPVVDRALRRTGTASAFRDRPDAGA